MAKKPKFYVVWEGRQPGIYTSWDEAEEQVKGYPEALFKAFSTMDEAEQALANGQLEYFAKPATEQATPSAVPTKTLHPLPTGVQTNAIAVDAACSGNPGQMEYRGVCLTTGRELFHFGPIFGTNNIGEFLAIVHGLALLAQRGYTIPIYSDSVNAMLWVKRKQCRTTLPLNDKTQALHEHIRRAEAWLRTHSYTNDLRKWETEKWGEIPADFGRKG